MLSRLPRGLCRLPTPRLGGPTVFGSGLPYVAAPSILCEAIPALEANAAPVASGCLPDAPVRHALAGSAPWRRRCSSVAASTSGRAPSCAYATC
jgi:hypothetical protein